MLHILNGSFQDERKRVAFFCILGMSKALCGQRPSVWWSAGSSAPANLYAVWSVCSTRLDARSNFSLWGVIWWPKATDMMDVLNRIDSLFEYFIHIDSISILCQAELLQSWWVTQHFQGCSQFLVQIWCGHFKSRQKAWDLSTFLFFGILSCEHKNCTDKNVNSGITCHYMSLLNYNFDSKLPICNSMILSGDHWCKHASAVHESYSQNKCAIEANIIRFCMSIGQYEIFLNYLEIQEENMENHETVCSVFHTEQTPSPQQFRDPVGGLWLTQPRVPEWNSWDPSGACSRANPASRHKLDTNYTLDVSMCEQRMQETCWTWRKHFWSLEAHRLKLFAKVQHVIGRVAVHWEASKSETGQSTHDEGLFLHLKAPSRFREILCFLPRLYGKPVFFFLRDIQKFMISVISKWGWNKPLSLSHRTHLSFPDWCSALAPQLHSPSPGNWNPQNQFGII